MENASYRGFFCAGNVGAENIGEYAVDEMANYVTDNLPEMTSKVTSEALGVAGLAFDIVQGIEEQKATDNFLDDWEDTEKQVEIYKSYGCMTNIAEYDTVEGKRTVLYGYEGKYTETIVNQSNAVFEEYGGRTFTVQEIIEKPSRVCSEYAECVNGNNEAEDKFNDATHIIHE